MLEFFINKHIIKFLDKVRLTRSPKIEILNHNNSIDKSLHFVDCSHYASLCFKLNFLLIHQQHRDTDFIVLLA